MMKNTNPASQPSLNLVLDSEPQTASGQALKDKKSLCAVFQTRRQSVRHVVEQLLPPEDLLAKETRSKDGRFLPKAFAKRFTYQVTEREGNFKADPGETYSCAKCGYQWTEADVNPYFRPHLRQVFAQGLCSLERKNSQDEWVCPSCANEYEAKGIAWTKEAINRKISPEAEANVAHRQMIQERIKQLKQMKG